MEKQKKKKKSFQYRPYNTRGKEKEELERWNEPKTTEIPLLSIDNWEVIAGYSDLSELITLAEVCSDTRLAARMVYKRDYGSQEFNLRVNQSKVEMSTLIKQKNFDYNQAIVVKNATCLKFLRNFGDLIHTMNIDTCNTTRTSDHRLRIALDYVNKYSGKCAKTLNVDKYLPIFLDEPLQNLVDIKLRTEIYSLGEFNTLIENVPSMEIRCDKIQNLFRQSMPQLRKIKIISRSLNDGFADSVIIRLMQLNPQIQELIIDIGRHNILRIKWNGTEIELRIKSDGNAIAYALIRPEQFKTMHLDCWQRFDYRLLGFLEKFLNVTSLSIDGPMWDMDRVIPAMPNLQEIQICARRISPIILYYINGIDSIISSATRHSKLSVLSFDIGSQHDFDIFRIQYGPRINPQLWSITFTDDESDKFKHSMVLKRIQST